jgi:alkylhydroperoxidase family enzyme
MAWVETVPVERAEGLLKKLFEQAIRRAGRVWNIVHVMSLNPPVMEGSMGFYRALMHGGSPLSRVQRELLATVVSAEVSCRY